MMAYEPYDCLADDSDDKYIDFEAEQELFTLFNPRPKATNPSTSMGSKPYTNPSTNSRSRKDNKDEYVPFKLFDETETETGTSSMTRMMNPNTISKPTGQAMKKSPIRKTWKSPI